MALFETFGRERRALTKSELGRLLNLPESSTSDLLTTLVDTGHVARTVSSRRFYPTGRLLEAAQAISLGDQLGIFSEEAAALLAETTGETAVFAVLDGPRVRLAGVSQGSQRLRYVVHIGDAFSVHGTGVGKALLSCLEPDDRAALLQSAPLRKLTDFTLTDLDDIERDLALSAERGWWGAVDEGTLGVSSVAVPGTVGTSTGALGVIGPSDRIAMNRELIIAEVKRVAGQVFNPLPL